MTIPVLPDWTRWSWASQVEREWWQPLFSAASTAYQDVERWSVVDGVRPACRTFIAPDQLVEATNWAQRNGILCVPIEKSARSTQYSSTSRPLGASEPFDYKILYVRPEYYSRIGNLTDDRLGELLGYPACCRRAFDDTWGHGQVDSTWEQTNAGVIPHTLKLTSTLMRWMGIRLVSHMPCTYECEASLEIAKQMFDVGIRHGYGDEMRLMAEVLNWPVEWSRLFGIAEITTPALKISTRTDWTPTKQAFSRFGHYQAPKKSWWLNNGFQSADGMRAAHRDMVDALITQLPPKARILDLGCGNGMLLRRLTIQRPDIRIAGVDHNADAIREAQETLDLRSTYWNGVIQDGMWVDWKPTVVLFNPARLREMSPADATRVSAWIRAIPWQFPYIYDDWQKQTSVTALCEEQHLTAPQPLIKTPRIEMGMVMPFT